ncbi:hypothetical protein ACFV1N_43555 [Streptosporangium canum]
MAPPSNSGWTPPAPSWITLTALIALIVAVEIQARGSKSRT